MSEELDFKSYSAELKFVKEFKKTVMSIITTRASSFVKVNFPNISAWMLDCEQFLFSLMAPVERVGET